MFPSQNAEDAKRKLAGQSSKELEAKKLEEAASRQELWIMIGIMAVILFVVSALMVETTSILKPPSLFFGVCLFPLPTNDFLFLLGRWALLGQWVRDLTLRLMNSVEVTSFPRERTLHRMMNYRHSMVIKTL